MSTRVSPNAHWAIIITQVGLQPMFVEFERTPHAILGMPTSLPATAWTTFVDFQQIPFDASARRASGDMMADTMAGTMAGRRHASAAIATTGRSPRLRPLGRPRQKPRLRRLGRPQRTERVSHSARHRPATEFRETLDLAIQSVQGSPAFEHFQGAFTRNDQVHVIRRNSRDCRTGQSFDRDKSR